MLSLPILRRVADAAAVSLDRRALLASMAASVVIGTVADAMAAELVDGNFARRLREAAPFGGDRVLGREDARVELIEYGSVTSGSCAKFHVDVLPVIQERYIDTGLVKYVFREYPMDQSALMVFMLTRCIPEAKYFSTLDMIFQRQSEWRGTNIKPELLKIMRSAGMSEADFVACLRRKELAHAIHETRQKARDVFGVEDTPTFFVNGRKVDDHESVTAVLAVIKSALEVAEDR